MDAAQTTAVLAGVMVPLVGFLVTYVMYKRKQRSDEDSSSVVSWRGMTERLDSERDALQKRVDESEERHRKEILEMEADWERRAAAMQKRIVELQNEVDALGRQLAAALRRSGGAV